MFIQSLPGVKEDIINQIFDHLQDEGDLLDSTAVTSLFFKVVKLLSYNIRLLFHQFLSQKPSPRSPLRSPRPRVIIEDSDTNHTNSSKLSENHLVFHNVISVVALTTVDTKE